MSTKETNGTDAMLEMRSNGLAHPSFQQELKSIKNLISKKLGENNTRYNPDDMGIATLFSDCFKHIVRYAPHLKSWVVYNGMRWVPDKYSIKVGCIVRWFVTEFRCSN